ncbi:MAG: bifunctional 5,10-methylene-tetrahydrofolate dehydrogenase/5,10-methylene-tetrahydrofolate cyclohydrolase [Crocinitomicaceae bacterium]|nr:bifunctional 5,10-methylene-tetrahydrofolate dehydrogenase/5,10-methylene-tetrahydrofolate cyclohydrolase [Crocinitomicaceae bacterium]
MILLDGNLTASAIKKEIAEKVQRLIAEGKSVPHLAAVLVGENGASLTYVNAKVKACEEVGFRSTLIHKPENISGEELLEIIEQLNSDPSIDGYIVQQPLPLHISEQQILLAIDPAKDVDGFHPENVGRVALGLPGHIPATPYGIIRLLDHYGVETEGKNAIVLGRSHIVGLPMAILLQRNEYPGNCTVTIAHSRTKDIANLCRSSDIIVAAIGKPGFVTADMVKEGAVVIDVGITRLPDASKKSGFRLKGDVDFDAVAPKTSFITPVPGGVGPMTIVSLLSNTLIASAKR